MIRVFLRKAHILLFVFSCTTYAQKSSIDLGMQNEIQIKVFKGEADKYLAPTINEWVASHYIRFPFLYVNQGEALSNHIIFEDPNGFVLIAEKARQKVGLLMALPLTSVLLADVDYNPASELEQIRKKGFDPDKILYGAVFFVSDEERQNKELIRQLYEEAVIFAKKMGKTQICYFTTVREENHPLKPNPFVPPEPWEDLSSPFRNMDIEVNFTWPTLQADGSVKECANPQALFIQDI